MFYYEVQPVSQSYKSNEPLTYSSSDTLKPYQIVSISILNKLHVLGIIVRRVSKPSFKTKGLSLLAQQYYLPENTLSLARWISTYYAADLGTTLQSFIPKTIAQKSKSTKAVDLLKAVTSKPPRLTTDQTKALKLFESGISSLLLHGDTGSGKTRVYIEMIKQVCSRGRSTVLLTPEISLVPQLIGQLKALKTNVLFIHSGLTPVQRRAIWTTIHDTNEPYVLVGPRSALFAPHKNVGLIIVDEFHESAYKQDQTPRYHALRVAAKLRELQDAQLVIGSATPNIEELYFFESKKLPVITMKPVSDATKAPPLIIDLKDKSLFSRGTLLSDVLVGMLQEKLEKNEQSLLLLNRRGTARLIVCSNCGWEMHCQRCDTNLTYHADSHDARCHTCGFHTKPPSNCPECSSRDIFYKGSGTKAVESEVERLFPKAKAMRFDTDNAKQERFEQNFEKIKQGDVDIIIGTQLVAKGLDLPKLTLVGVLNADTSMSFPDFTAEEKTYQLLYQVMGRVNRGHMPGEVVLQSLHPESLTIQSVVENSWDAFYESQLEQRRAFRFPPFAFILKISAERKQPAAAEKALQDLQRKIRAHNLPISIDSPAPGFIEKKRGSYTWHMVIRSKSRSHLLAICSDIRGDFTIDLDPSGVL